MLAIPYGVDADETWELDYTKASTERLIRANRAAAKRLRDDAAREPDAKKKTALELSAAALEERAVTYEKALADYKPGSGPVFIVGAIPNGKRGELSGEAFEVSRLEDEKTAGERDDRWAEQVVRWSVRGHRNFLRRNGSELLFASEPTTWAGEQRQVVSRKTLEDYGASRILRELALLVLASQQLDEAGKNA